MSIVVLASLAVASSHREAPAIAIDPTADISDFYMFKDPNDTSNLVFVLNVNPLEAPGGGPNFYRFDDNVLYEIKVDNEGDGAEDVVFQFQFETTYPDPSTFLYNVGSVADPANLHMIQTYTVTRLDDGVATSIGAGTVAPINVGTQSTPVGGYAPNSSSPGSITAAHVVTAGSYALFAGPRQDDFYVDLERTFDMLNLVGADATLNQNTLIGYNVHAIAIELPAEMLTKDGNLPTEANQNNVIAAWATTSRRAVTVRRAESGATVSRGEWVQVSRLGNPLVNEVMIPLRDKDIFNAAQPIDDGQFLAYVTDPLLVTYMNLLVAPALGITCPTEADLGVGVGGREDLVLAYLTGHPSVGNRAEGFALAGEIPGEPGKVFAPYEALRINLDAGHTSLGFWPDGRNIGDDVVDISLSAVCGYLIDGTTWVSDGVDSTGLGILSTFPFLGDPWAGDDHPNGGHEL